MPDVLCLVVHCNSHAETTQCATRHLRHCELVGLAVSQALFRKIAAALPGMESVSQNKAEQMEEVKLTTSIVNIDAKPPPPPSSCSC